MNRVSPFSAQGRFADWRLATQSIIGFWAFYLVTVLLRGLFDPEAATAIGYRSINAALGLALTFLIYVAIRLFARDASIRRMAIVAAIAALPAALIMSVVGLIMTTSTWTDPIAPASKIMTQEGVAIVQRGNVIRIVQDDGDELQVDPAADEGADCRQIPPTDR